VDQTVSRVYTSTRSQEGEEALVIADKQQNPKNEDPKNENPKNENPKNENVDPKNEDSKNVDPKNEDSKNEASEETHTGISMHEQSEMVRPDSSILPLASPLVSKGIMRQAADSTSHSERLHRYVVSWLANMMNYESVRSYIHLTYVWPDFGKLSMYAHSWILRNTDLKY